MAKYQIGSQPFYRLGAYYPEYSVVELPDDDKPENRPSKTWTPLDASAAEALSKLTKKTVQVAAAPESKTETPKDTTPSTMHEAQKKNRPDKVTL